MITLERLQKVVEQRTALEIEALHVTPASLNQVLLGKRLMKWLARDRGKFPGTAVRYSRRAALFAV